jgi:general secretion pathway protein K
MMKRLLARLRRPVQIRRDRGVALIMVSVVIACLGALVSEFSYNARVDLEAAANGRDLLRAEYLARSGVALSRLLIKVQNAVLDPNRKYIGDVQIADFAPYLIRAFGGEADERAGLGALLGFDSSSLKGMGAGKGASFDVQMTSDDGRLNINCGGGLNDLPRQAALYGVLSSLFWPPRYNRLFESPDADGQINTRDDVARAIVDWADVDETRFEPAQTGRAASSGSGPEDYRYDASRDPYRAHNHFFDTTEEVHLVRGFGDETYGSFAELFTAYGTCKINLGALRPESWPLIAAVIRGTVKDEKKNDPILTDEVLLAALAQRVIQQAQLLGGFNSVSDFIKLVGDPNQQIDSTPTGIAALTGQQPSTTSSPSSSSSSSSSGVTGVALDPNKVNQVVTTGARRIWRLDSVGLVERTKERKVQVHIRAVWDTTHFNQNTTSGDPNDRQGTWVYYRLD